MGYDQWLQVAISKEGLDAHTLLDSLSDSRCTLILEETWKSSTLMRLV